MMWKLNRKQQKRQKNNRNSKEKSTIKRNTNGNYPTSANDVGVCSALPEQTSGRSWERSGIVARQEPQSRHRKAGLGSRRGACHLTWKGSERGSEQLRPVRSPAESKWITGLGKRGWTTTSGKILWNRPRGGSNKGVIRHSSKSNVQTILFWLASHRQRARWPGITTLVIIGDMEMKSMKILFG